jgi:hypothetical protein
MNYGIRMLDIPFIVGYQVNDAKWKVSVNGGPIFNAATKYGGYISDPQSGFQSARSSGFVKRQIGWKVYGGINVARQLNDHSQVFAEPSFIYHLGEMSRNTNYFSLRWHQASVSVGVKYLFGDAVSE